MATPARNISLSIRGFSSTVPNDSDPESVLGFPEWVDANTLEEAAQAPWLPSVPEDHQERLRRAYALLLLIIMYFRGPNAQKVERDEAEIQRLFTVILSSCISAARTHGFSRCSNMPQSPLNLTLAEHDVPSGSSSRR